MNTVEIASFPNFILTRSGLDRATQRRLADAASLPDWVLNSQDTMVPSMHQLRLWEQLEYELDDPDVALRIGGGNTLGQFGVHDYLFSTATTLAEGLTLAGEFAHLVTTNVGLTMYGESAGTVSADIHTLQGLGRGRQLATQFVLAVVLARARSATGRNIRPIRIRLRQCAPRHHHRFVEVLGTTRIDFGAPTDQITLRATDLDLPMRTADPALAMILRRWAPILPPPRRLDVTWAGQVHQVLTVLLADGRVTIDHAARHLATSRRSLQRRLADEGTTWTRELDRARATLVEQQCRLRPEDTRAALARRVGYSDAGALRRARQRWSAGERTQTTTSDS